MRGVACCAWATMSLLGALVRRHLHSKTDYELYHLSWAPGIPWPFPLHRSQLLYWLYRLGMTTTAHMAGLLPNSQRLFLIFCPRTKWWPRKVLCIKVTSSMTSMPWELTQAIEVNLIILGSRHNNYKQTVTSYTRMNHQLSLCVSSWVYVMERFCDFWWSLHLVWPLQQQQKHYQISLQYW